MIRFYPRRHASLAINLLSTAIALVGVAAVRAHGRTPRPLRALVVLFALGGLLVAAIIFGGKAP